MESIDKKNKYCVYTCLIGKYDCLFNYNCYDKDFDYICFTNIQELIEMKKLGYWKIIPVDSNLLMRYINTQINRYYKMLHYLEMIDYDVTIYIDSNISIKSPYIYELAKTTNKPLLVPENIVTKNIYRQILYCYAYKQDSKQNLKKIYNFLHREGMPTDYGFTENNLIIRRRDNALVEEIMKEWWSFIIHYSKRDQTSFVYLLWKHRLMVDEIQIPNIMYDNNNFTRYPHLSGLRIWTMYRLYDKTGRLYTPISNPTIFIRACKDTVIALLKYPRRKYILHHYADSKRMSELFSELN